VKGQNLYPKFRVFPTFQMGKALLEWVR